MHPKSLKIGIIGGTGKEGSALALRFGYQGATIYLGSRDEKKAQTRADKLNKKLRDAGSTNTITGENNHTVIVKSDIILFSIPYCLESKVTTEVPIKSILEENTDYLENKVLVDIIVPPKLHAPVLITGNDLENYRKKFGEGKTPSVTEEIYLFCCYHLDFIPRLVAAFKTISFLRLADIPHDLLDEILIWGFEDRDIQLVKDLCSTINTTTEPRIHCVPQIFWRSVEGVCEYIREQTLQGEDIMALTFSYRSQD